MKRRRLWSIRCHVETATNSTRVNPRGRSRSDWQNTARRAVQKSDVNNRVAMHVANISHSVDWANARVVKMVPGYWEKRTHRSHSDQEEPGPHELGQWTPTPQCLEPYLTKHTLIATPTLMMSLIIFQVPSLFIQLIL